MEQIFKGAPKLYMIVMFIVLLSSVVWLYIGALHSEFNIWLRLVMIIIGILALLVMANRDVYLPFLGETALPSHIIQPTQQKGNVMLTLRNLPANTKVLYWAAKPGMKSSDQPMIAYKDSTNVGVTISDMQGNAKIVFDCPQRYTVNRLGFDKVLPKHVHYRFEMKDMPGMFSRVFTEFIQCDE